ncbi:trimethyllysine dioxygenase [Pseudomassariella vexata]|uniref:Trimethyllysine dioxygenase n=1 Tax=Pseudomassariella vexata TaxID=1141098 RepID=A0A1Y2EL36_9PEZI|nr:trimethyllysine dioxygenase [Pseudomassariella vexata]ORY71575.1 trimethyllysine dioxygenase [Pseudomassariella vexata]
MAPWIYQGRTLACRVLRPSVLFPKTGHQYHRRLGTIVAKPVVSNSSDSLSFSYESGNQNMKRTSLPNFWLRDNCRCRSCVHQDTMQRNFNTFDIPKDVRPLKVETQHSGVQIRWSDNAHESFYTWEFLESYLKADRPQLEPVELEYFGADGSQYSTAWPPSVQNQDILSDETKAVGRLTDLISKFGFAFITGVPIESGEATEKLLEKIAFIRHTHYGGFYDFIPNLAMADTAYTNIALAAHTDTTYFSDPAGLQAFHLLSHSDPNAKDGTATLGGQSLLVDGFYAASLLKEEDPKAFQVLSQVRLPWHASGNEGITISPDKLYPVLEVDDRMGKMHRVRWNNDDRGVVPFDGGFSPTEWYDAARKWNSILRRNSVEYWFQLTPGSLLVFNNWRVLHGRSAFTGVRRMCGGYINRDDFISRWRNTNYHREEILRRIIG